MKEVVPKEAPSFILDFSFFAEGDTQVFSHFFTPILTNSGTYLANSKATIFNAKK